MGSTPTELGFREFGFRSGSGGGASVLDDLLDVTISPDPPVVDGQFLVWDLAGAQWENKTVAPGVGSLGLLTDVTIGPPDPPVTPGAFLQYGGAGQWIDTLPNLNALFDVGYAGIADGDKLFRSAGAWTNLPDILGNLKDVTLAGLANGDGIQWVSGSSDWQNLPRVGPRTLGAAADFDQLFWDTGVWVNRVANLEIHGDIAAPLGQVDGTILRWDAGASEWQASTAPTNLETARREPMVTGIFTGGVVTVNANNTSVDVAAGTGVIVDSYTDGNNPVVTEVSWGAQNVPIPTITSRRNTWIAIDSAGTAILYTARPTTGEWRSTINLAIIGHDVDAATLDKVFAALAPSGGSLGQLQDLIRRNIEIDGGLIVPGTALTMEIEGNDAIVFSPGVNWHTDPFNPDEVTVVQPSPLVYDYKTGDNTQGLTNQTVIDNTQYNPGGGSTISAIPGINARGTIQRLFLHIAGEYEILYGQDWYGGGVDGVLSEFNFDEAITIVPPDLQDALFLAWIITIKGATDITDPADALILNSDIPSGAIGAISAGLYQDRVLPSPATLVFDSNVTYQEFTQTAQIDITLSGSGAINGRIQVVKIVGDGVNDITFSADYVNGSTGAQQTTINAATDIYLFFQYNESLTQVMVWQSTVGSVNPNDIALLGGRSGGQDLAGGTGANDNLTLRSTTNITKGNVRLRDTFLVGPTITAPDIGAESEFESQVAFQKGLLNAALNNASLLDITRFNTSFSAPTSILDAQTLGQITFNGPDVVPAINTAAAIICVSRSNWTAGNYSSDMQFYTAITGTIGERMRVAETGQIRMGASLGFAPDASPVLTVRKDSGSNHLEILNGGAGIATLQLDNVGGTVAAPSQTLASVFVGGIGFRGWDTVGPAFRSIGSITMQTSENVTTAAHGGRMLFGTVLTGGNVPATRIQIEDDGRVQFAPTGILTATFDGMARGVIQGIGNLATYQTTSPSISTEGGGGFPTFQTLRHNGLVTAKTAVTTGNSLGQRQAWGYGATVYALGFTFDANAAENWTDLVRGVSWAIQSVDNGAATVTQDFAKTGAGLFFLAKVPNNAVNNVNMQINAATGELSIPVSSREFKENIEDLRPIRFDSLRPVEFDFKKNGVHSIGMIAEEVKPLVPEAVWDMDDKMGIHYEMFVAILIKEVQELKARVAMLEA